MNAETFRNQNPLAPATIRSCIMDGRGCSAATVELNTLTWKVTFTFSPGYEDRDLAHLPALRIGDYLFHYESAANDPKVGRAFRTLLIGKPSRSGDASYADIVNRIERNTLLDEDAHARARLIVPDGFTLTLQFDGDRFVICDRAIPFTETLAILRLAARNARKR